MPAEIPPSQAFAQRILVAEDDSSVRTFIARALEHAGYRVTAVEDGAIALELLKKDAFDLLITDIKMPRLDGISLILKSNQNRPDLKTLLITGYPAEKQRASFLLKNCSYTFLSKPFTLADIQNHVVTALAMESVPLKKVSTRI